MGLKLDDTEIDYENGGTIKSNSTSFSTHSYDGDDFNEDTVYIANRYASAAPVTPPSAAEIRAANNIFVKPTLMLAGAAIEILVYFIFGFLRDFAFCFLSFSFLSTLSLSPVNFTFFSYSTSSLLSSSLMRFSFFV